MCLGVAWGAHASSCRAAEPMRVGVDPSEGIGRAIMRWRAGALIIGIGACDTEGARSPKHASRRMHCGERSVAGYMP